ncbi:patatin-like phospholipase family protein [Bradyrhizobium liaoningense]|uniref:patatin-like phospholipase family protein n=1 Tax=Bradyrhizobium liaoningense TaxID=43992 RepID=UPI001BA99A89|nr:patatin-like phospholipase family protein [Bradyrhizobium liaoningense]MBR0718176.1 patatin-like phospholipase family protein [Bradyrhizobium liaoningense]
MASDGDRPQAPLFEPNLPAANDETSWDAQFSRIVDTEFEAVNSRRAALEALRLADGLDRTDTPVDADKPFTQLAPAGGKMVDVVGLALSGGGIRSSALCLGVLQALNHHDLIKRIDYLSTVSGGGYIGSSLSATMTAASRFAFGEKPVPGQKVRASEISDTPAVGHIRNYSNYLIPAGGRDLITGIAIVVRGLVANIGFALPVVLLLAAITIFSNPARSCLYAPNLFGVAVRDGQIFSFLGNHETLKTLGFTLSGIVVALIVFIAGLIHRVVSPVNRRELFAYLAGIAVVMGVICNIAHYLPVAHFALTLSSGLLGLLLFLLWALWRSCLPDDHLQEFRSHLPTMGATYLVLVGAIAFFEFQPFMIAQMFGVAEDGGTDQSAGLVAGVVVGWIKSLAVITAPIAAIVTLFRQQFGDLLKGAGASDLTSRILAYVAKAAVWIAGLALPLLIWIGYLYLCFWGIANDKVVGAYSRQCDVSSWSAAPMLRPVESVPQLSGKIQFDSQAKTLSADIASKEAAPADEVPKVTAASHIPGWLLAAAKLLGDPNPDRWSMTLLGYYRISNNINLPMVLLYVIIAVVLFIVSWLMRPNANSLHRLYRDRLSKAFLFMPEMPKRRVAKDVPSIDQGRDFPELDLKLSQLCPRTADDDGANNYRLAAPYHLINAALNIQGSDYANRRGRNADFFLFSPVWTGSEATGYCDTAKLERKETGLDLATAMAISGAAASSNMGANSIKPLTPTLALLNVRLGYWLKNPQYVDDLTRPQHRSTLYLWAEITGRLYENADAVYLTDGGHIENLGAYELLRRRCKVIVAVDAEADASMNFGSLMTLQRYARIDLGIRIDLPWTQIRDRTRAIMALNAGKKAAEASADKSDDDAEKDHVHVAIGTIDYGCDQTGYLVYIKSSLTGDENDYIRDYARRNDTFPHETTGDQFFSEEQFEVYRALGFHMTHGFLHGDHPVAVGPGIAPRTARFTQPGEETIDKVRRALGWQVVQPPAITADPVIGPDQG